MARVKEPKLDNDVDTPDSIGPQVIDSEIDLSQLPKQKHNWVQRGAKVSCEGANHMHHSHFLVRRGNING